MRRRPRSTGSPPGADDGDQPWPPWATAPIEVLDPDAGWAEQGARLAQAMGDLLATIRSLGDAHAANRGLRVAGWSLVPPDLDGLPWRRLYVLADGDRRLANLQLVESTHPRVAQMVLFRDRLRTDPDLAGAYASLKREADHRPFRYLGDLTAGEQHGPQAGDGDPGHGEEPANWYAGEALERRTRGWR